MVDAGQRDRSCHLHAPERSPWRAGGKPTRRADVDKARRGCQVCACSLTARRDETDLALAAGLTTQDVAPCPVALCYSGRSDDARLLGIQRRLGVGNQRSGTQRMNAHQPRLRKNPPMTSVGQCAPAHTRPKQASKITSPATTHTIRRQRGPTCGEIAVASMNDSHVK